MVAAFVACLAAPPIAGASPVVAYVGNHSAEVTNADIANSLPAFQTAVSRDFAPVWGTDAVLTTDPAAEQTANMLVYVNDEPDCWGCLGYHDVVLGRPTSYVFADLAEQYHDSWQLILTHELFEMLADPWINRYAIWSHRTWLVEVCDQVEDGYYAYRIGPVVISDFIFPKWFDSRLKGPVDFTHGLKRSGQIGRHG